MKNTKSVQIPEKLLGSLKLHLKQSNFKSVDDFIIYILQNYLDQQTTEKSQTKSSNDDAEVLKRLQDLGYM
jgi:Arc/MetJ-type ribon-helix-helix transcriptional regulator